MSSEMERTQFVHKLLKTHVENDRLSSTYLFSGDDDSEKEKTAEALAKALNCENNRIFEFCECSSCRKIENKSHPDVHWMGDDPKARSIKIGEVRDLKNKVSLKAYEGRWKVFTFLNADRLTDEAQNSLLKTLEEPPERTVFCLLVANKAHLFETIRSRSFEIRFPPSDNIEIMQGLAREFFSNCKTDTWEDFLSGYQGKTRQDLASLMDVLMWRFHELIRSECAETPAKLAAGVKAIESLCQAKQAIQDNVNVKLALTRLATRLRKITSVTRIVSRPEATLGI